MIQSDPSIIEDLCARIDTWQKQAIPPLAITPVGQVQVILTWHNIVHSFLSPDWKLQQATYYTNQWNPSSVTTWTVDLLHLILKYYAHQQLNHRNQVLHKLQPDWVKDLALDIKIQQQYDHSHTSLPTASQPLLNCTLL